MASSTPPAMASGLRRVMREPPMATTVLTPTTPTTAMAVSSEWPASAERPGNRIGKPIASAM